MATYLDDASDGFVGRPPRVRARLEAVDISAPTAGVKPAGLPAIRSIVYTIGDDGSATLVAWAFQPYAAIEAVLLGYTIMTEPTKRDNRLVHNSRITPIDDLQHVVFRKDLDRDRVALVTREANGFLFMCYWQSQETVMVYDMFETSTEAIDALAKETKTYR